MRFGHTVYNFAHIGNLRTYIFEDILRRTLEFNGYNVKHVMNITDVGHLTSDADEGEDKMELSIKKEKKSAYEIAEKYSKAFFNDLKDLNIQSPTTICKATDHIKEMIDLVKALEKKGFTYQTSDGIYFDTSNLKDYGKLARLQIDQLKEGFRIEKKEKRNKSDFALWKFSPKDKKREMEWPSPWKVGFPGWHIECSAMSIKYLGEQFDIHCGGIDHIPVHHTNEIAQSESFTGKKPWVKYWLHGEFLIVDEGKMSKSENNFLTLQSLKNKGYDPLVYRFFCLETQYRKQLKFSFESLDNTKNSLERLKEFVRKIKSYQSDSLGYKDLDKLISICEKGFKEEINNDLEIPGALAYLFDFIKQINILLSEEKLSNQDAQLILEFIEKIDSILGILKEEEIPNKITKLAAERVIARENKDWKKSDELRDKIKQLGYQVDDSKKKIIIKKI
ncbi:MAG TPA: cysteine--tRNA ligase [Candidatus Nanoarchaeia archaeon]|nr:cysteine--tRNA ligase [Candidatus Nanoarchaeia archaeon]